MNETFKHAVEPYTETCHTRYYDNSVSTLIISGKRHEQVDCGVSEQNPDSLIL
jgi:hypothetical protein